MRRIEHFNDPDAPAADSLVPAASAIVVDQAGRILLHRRVDNELWSIPGGGMEIGERIADTVVREVREETGLEVEPERIVGVYSDRTTWPSTTTGRFASSSRSASPAGWSGRCGHQRRALEVGFFAPAEIASMPMHESIRLRIQHYLEHRLQPVIA